MNEDLLRTIFETNGYDKIGTFEKFRNDMMSSGDLRRTVYTTNGYDKIGPFEKFEKDLSVPALYAPELPQHKKGPVGVRRPGVIANPGTTDGRLSDFYSVDQGLKGVAASVSNAVGPLVNAAMDLGGGTGLFGMLLPDEYNLPKIKKVTRSDDETKAAEMLNKEGDVLTVAKSMYTVDTEKNKKRYSANPQIADAEQSMEALDQYKSNAELISARSRERLKILYGGKYGAEAVEKAAYKYTAMSLMGDVAAANAFVKQEFPEMATDPNLNNVFTVNQKLRDLSIAQAKVAAKNPEWAKYQKKVEDKQQEVDIEKSLWAEGGALRGAFNNVAPGMGTVAGALLGPNAQNIVKSRAGSWAKNLADVSPIGDEGAIRDWGREMMDFNPRSSDFQGKAVEDYKNVRIGSKTYDVVYDSSDPTTAKLQYIRDPKTKMMVQPDRDQLKAIKSAAESAEMKRRFNARPFVGQTADVLVDMAPIAALTYATGGLGNLARGTAGAAAGRSAGIVVGSGLQMRGEIMDQLLLHPDISSVEADLYSSAIGTGVGLLSLINPMESGMMKNALPGILKSNAAKLVNKKITKGQFAWEVIKDMGALGGKETAEELSQEWFQHLAMKGIDGAQRGIGKFSNNEAPTSGDMTEIALVSSAVAILGGAGSIRKSRNAMIDDALEHALANPKLTEQFLSDMQQGVDIIADETKKAQAQEHLDRTKARWEVIKTQVGSLTGVSGRTRGRLAGLIADSNKLEAELEKITTAPEAVRKNKEAEINSINKQIEELISKKKKPAIAEDEDGWNYATDDDIDLETLDNISLMGEEESLAQANFFEKGQKVEDDKGSGEITHINHTKEGGIHSVKIKYDDPTLEESTVTVFQKTPQQIGIKVVGDKNTIGEVTQKEFTDFQNNKGVSGPRMNSIANKIVEKIDLNDKEKAMYTPNSEEIETIVSDLEKKKAAAEKNKLDETKPLRPSTSATDGGAGAKSETGLTDESGVGATDGGGTKPGATLPPSTTEPGSTPGSKTGGTGVSTKPRPAIFSDPDVAAQISTETDRLTKKRDDDLAKLARVAELDPEFDTATRKAEIEGRYEEGLKKAEMTAAKNVINARKKAAVDEMKAYGKETGTSVKDSVARIEKKFDDQIAALEEEVKKAEEKPKEDEGTKEGGEETTGELEGTAKPTGEGDDAKGDATGGRPDKGRPKPKIIRKRKSSFERARYVSEAGRKALALIVGNDKEGMVMQYLIENRINSAIIRELYGGKDKRGDEKRIQGEVIARLGMIDNKAKAKTIAQLGHEIWEYHGMPDNVDSQELADAAESVIQSYKSVKQMADTLLTRLGDPELEDQIRWMMDHADPDSWDAAFFALSFLNELTDEQIQQIADNEFDFENSPEYQSMVLGEEVATEAEIQEEINEPAEKPVNPPEPETTELAPGAKGKEPIGPKGVSLVTTKSADIISALNELPTVEAKLDWLKQAGLLQPMTIGGKVVNAVDYYERVMVMMKIGDVAIPFYISTGKAGKKNVAAGKWYATFGIADSGWINKGTEAEINNQYGFPVLQKIAKILDDGVGHISLQQENGRIKPGYLYLTDENIDAFNAHMNIPSKPAPNGDTGPIRQHAANVLNAVNRETELLSKKATDKEPPSPPATPTAREPKEGDRVMSGKNTFYTITGFTPNGDVQFSNTFGGRGVWPRSKFDQDVARGELRYYDEPAPPAVTPAKEPTGPLVNDTPESIAEKLRKPLSQRIVLNGVEYVVTNYNTGVGSPDITMIDKDGKIFYHQEKTADGRIIERKPTVASLIRLAKEQAKAPPAEPTPPPVTPPVVEPIAPVAEEEEETQEEADARVGLPPLEGSEFLTPEERAALPSWMDGKIVRGPDERLQDLQLKDGDSVRNNYNGIVYTVRLLTPAEAKAETKKQGWHYDKDKKYHELTDPNGRKHMEGDRSIFQKVEPKTPPIEEVLGKSDIINNIYNIDNPLATKTVDGVTYKIVDGGTIVNGKRTINWQVYRDNTLIGEYGSVAEAKAATDKITAKPIAAADAAATPAKEHKDNITKKFKEVFVAKGVPEDQVDAALGLMEARANSWASEVPGRNPDEWYDRIADVKDGAIVPEEPAAKVATVTKTTPVGKKKTTVVKPGTKKGELQDVGEKIGGAKKDIAQAIKQLSEVTDDDIRSKPLSKIFPRPNYKKLVQDGTITQDGAILLKYLYDNIPKKPQGQNQQRRVERWVDSVGEALEAMKRVLEAESTKDIDFTKRIVESDAFSASQKQEYKLYSDTMKGIGFPLEVDSAGEYKIYKAETMSQWNDTEKKNEYVQGPFYHVRSGYRILDTYKTMGEATARIKELVLRDKEAGPKPTEFGVYTNTGTGAVFIGKKGANGVVRIVEGFLTTTQAKKFLDEKQAEVQAIWDGMRMDPNERRSGNRARKGEDWRKGKDVTSKEFSDQFGFRGVEFGNWVNVDERQSSVNEAYDALMDMATAIGVSPKALSLNGELAFAFGARGSGKAMAHYEPGKVVINLTKTRGAGSLAHEWWHAMDNYFSRMKGDKGGMLTAADKGGGNVRQEMADAYRNINRAIGRTNLKTRSKVIDATRTQPYWSTNVEMTARAFENYIIQKLAEKNHQNDYLANFKETGEWISSQKEGIDALKNYPYPLEDEQDTINESYEQFFQTIQEDDNARLYQDDKGAIEVLSDGRKVILALHSPDFSTIVHELAHIFEGDLTVDEHIILEDEYGKDEKARKEQFARDFERYALNGEAPSPELQTIFDKFRNWMLNIYNSLVGTPIENEISPRVKAIFDRLLTEHKPTVYIYDNDGNISAMKVINRWSTTTVMETPSGTRMVRDNTDIFDSEIEAQDAYDRSVREAPKPPKPAPEPKKKPSTEEKKAQRKVRDAKQQEKIKGLWDDFLKGDNTLTVGGLDPKRIEAGTKLVGAYIEMGVYKFADIIQDAYAMMGDKLEGYFDAIKSVYSTYYNVQATAEEADKMDANLRSFTYESLTDQFKEDVSDRPGDSEGDSQGGEDRTEGDQTDLPSEDGRGGRDTGTGDQGEDIVENGERESGQGDSGLLPPPLGEQTDISLHPEDGKTKSKENRTGDVNGRGNSYTGTEGSGSDKPGSTSSDPGTKGAVTTFQERSKIAQKKQVAAEPIEAISLDPDNIRATLPYLLPQQQEDVVKAEQRFFGPEHDVANKARGKGMLFTNGTGTGKTLVALGVAKRFVKQGKGNILIVTPSQAKVSDWQEEGAKLLLTVNPLQSIKDAGTGIVTTTFNNFTKNKAILARDFDLIIYDESHRVMEAKDGKESNATEVHRMIGNKNQYYAERRLKEIHPLWIKDRELSDKLRELEKKPLSIDFQWAQKVNEVRILEGEIDAIRDQQKLALPDLKRRAENAVNQTKVVFLSATPFKEVENLKYANGFLFDWGEDQVKTNNQYVSPETNFFLSNFGSKWRLVRGRLTKQETENPDAVTMQEIQFSQKLRDDAVLRGQIINSEQDYSRDFPKVSGFKSDDFNRATNDIFSNEAFRALSEPGRKVFRNTPYTTQLFESLKTSMSIDRIKKHVAMGRKIVIFHRRKMAEAGPPFQSVYDATYEAAEEMVMQGMTAAAFGGGPAALEKARQEADKMREQADAFKRKYADLFAYEQTLNYDSTIDQITAAFGDQAVFINGDVTGKVTNKHGKRVEKKVDNIARFNDDGSGVNIIVVQEDSGKEGISLHDTTGKHPRVLMSMSMPNSTTTALQIEGRIFRLGQATDAVFEYPLLGLDLEIEHYGRNLNRRLSTTENLAMGENSRDLIRSYSEGVLFNSTTDDPHEEQGKGGKEYDKRVATSQSEFQKARLVYATNQKVKGRRDQREGVDYYPTPEPVGQKMVEWANIRVGDSALEPSAGHGAIAMWFPISSSTTSIEPEYPLYTKLTGRAGGGSVKVLNERFEQLNIINKFDAVTMNPPFGIGGKTAMDHIEKAFKHLREGGRIVALVPTGQMDKRIEKFFTETDERGKLIHGDAHLRKRILLPSSTFVQAGTSVNTQIIIIDKLHPRNGELGNEGTLDLTDASGVQDLFDQIEHIQMPDRPARVGVSREYNSDPYSTSEPTKNVAPASIMSPSTEYRMPGTNELVYSAKLTKYLPGGFKEVAETARKFNGQYDGESRTFLFKTKGEADSFVEQVNGRQSSNPQFSMQEAVREATTSLENRDPDPNAQIIVMLNNAHAKPQERLEQYAGVWLRVIKNHSPDFHAKGLELIKGTPYEDASPGNPEEALAKAIADRAVRIKDRDTFVGYIKQFWKRVGIYMRLNLTPEYMQDMTIGEYLDIAGGQLRYGSHIYASLTADGAPKADLEGGTGPTVRDNAHAGSPEELSNMLAAIGEGLPPAKPAKAVPVKKATLTPAQREEFENRDRKAKTDPIGNVKGPTMERMLKTYTGNRKKVLDSAILVMPTLKQAGISITFHENQDSYSNAVVDHIGTPSQAMGSNGFYNDKQVHINMSRSSMNPNTALHEAFHPIIRDLLINNPKAFSRFISDIANDPELRKRYMEEFAGRYEFLAEKQDELDEEVLVEASADIVMRRILENLDDMPENLFDRVLKYIKDALGASYGALFRYVNTKEDFKAFAESMAEAISSGMAIPITPTTKAGIKTTIDESIQMAMRKKQKETAGPLFGGAVQTDLFGAVNNQPTLQQEPSTQEALDRQKEFDQEQAGIKKEDKGKPAFSMAPPAGPIHSEPFKDWFGDWQNNPTASSKVVDEQGKPLAVYHGTPSPDQITKYKKGKHGLLGPGIYFTNDKNYAKDYANKRGADQGNVAELYLAIKKPFMVIGPDGAVDLLRKLYGEAVVKRRTDSQGNINYLVTAADHRKLKAQGYDGIIYKVNDKPGAYTEYVAFKPYQVKSATDNNGQYSPYNDDIRFSMDDTRQATKDKIIATFRQHMLTNPGWDFEPIAAMLISKNLLTKGEVDDLMFMWRAGKNMKLNPDNMLAALENMTELNRLRKLDDRANMEVKKAVLKDVVARNMVHEIEGLFKMYSSRKIQEMVEDVAMSGNAHPVHLIEEIEALNDNDRPAGARDYIAVAIALNNMADERARFKRIADRTGDPASREHVELLTASMARLANAADLSRSLSGLALGIGSKLLNFAELTYAGEMRKINAVNMGNDGRKTKIDPKDEKRVSELVTGINLLTKDLKDSQDKANPPELRANAAEQEYNRKVRAGDMKTKPVESKAELKTLLDRLRKGKASFSLAYSLADDAGGDTDLYYDLINKMIRIIHREIADEGGTKGFKEVVRRIQIEDPLITEDDVYRAILSTTPAAADAVRSEYSKVKATTSKHVRDIRKLSDLMHKSAAQILRKQKFPTSIEQNEFGELLRDIEANIYKIDAKPELLTAWRNALDDIRRNYQLMFLDEHPSTKTEIILSSIINSVQILQDNKFRNWLETKLAELEKEKEMIEAGRVSELIAKEDTGYKKYPKTMTELVTDADGNLVFDKDGNPMTREVEYNFGAQDRKVRDMRREIELIKAKYKNPTPIRTFFKRVRNTMGSAMAMMDFSYFAIQGFKMLTTAMRDPKLFYKAFTTSVKVMANEFSKKPGLSNEIHKALVEDYYYAMGQSVGLTLTSPDSHVYVNEMFGEDDFFDIAYERLNRHKDIIRKGLAKGFGLRRRMKLASNAAFATHLNILSQNQFSNYVRKYVEKNGANPPMEEMKIIAAEINNATGRPNVEQKYTDAASTFLWAPKLYLSQILNVSNIAADPIQYAIHARKAKAARDRGDIETAKVEEGKTRAYGHRAINSMLFAGTMSAIYIARIFLAKVQCGDQFAVYSDETKPNFLKISCGELTFDPSGGHRQWLGLGARLLAGTDGDLIKGFAGQRITSKEQIMDQFAYKLNPLFSFMSQQWDVSDFLGRPRIPGDESFWKWRSRLDILMDHLKPMAGKTAVEIAQAKSIPDASKIPTIMEALLGFNVQVIPAEKDAEYKKKTEEVKAKKKAATTKEAKEQFRKDYGYQPEFEGEFEDTVPVGVYKPTKGKYTDNNGTYNVFTRDSDEDGDGKPDYYVIKKRVRGKNKGKKWIEPIKDENMKRIRGLQQVK